MYRWKPADPSALGKLPFFFLHDEKFVKMIGNEYETGKAFALELIKLRCRLVKLMEDCGILPKASTQELDPEKASEWLEQAATDFKNMSENELRLQAAIMNHKISMFSKSLRELQAPTLRRELEEDKNERVEEASKNEKLETACVECGNSDPKCFHYNGEKTCMKCGAVQPPT
jgi:hypothetical protein